MELEGPDDGTERRERLLENRARGSGIPQKWHGTKVEDLDPRGRSAGLLKAAAQWGAGELQGLLLVGAVGVGKTTVAAAAACARLSVERVVWKSASSLMLDLSLPFADPVRGEALKLLNDLKLPLVLDDLDKVPANEYAVQQLFAGVDNRYAEGAPLLVTSNLRPSELAKRYPPPYGEAIVSRLLEHCRGFELGGDDRRRS